MCRCIVYSITLASPTEVHGNSNKEHDNAVTLFGFRKEDVWWKGRYSSCCLTGLTFDLKASHLPEEDGAEQEDGIEKQQAQTQPSIQPPAVQMNTHHRQEHRCQQQDDRIHQSFIIYGD